MIKKILLCIKHFFDRLYIKKTGISISKNSYIKRPYEIEGGKNITIGSGVSINAYAKLSCFEHYACQDYTPSIKICDDVFINRFVNILSAASLEIGSGTMLGTGVSIVNENHGSNISSGLYRKQPLYVADVKIGNNCWIGDHSIILPGVHIGDNTIIGAGSVVTHSIEDHCIAVGNPARVIKKWNPSKGGWDTVPAERKFRE